MATINYNCMELEEFPSDKPVVFEKPRKALCWDGDNYDTSSRSECNVIAVIPYMNPPIYTESRDGRQDSSWYHCALLPDPPKPRRATNRELARWLAQGNGEIQNLERGSILTALIYSTNEEHEDCLEDKMVRKWSDTEWHEPTVDYLFGGEP